MTAFKAKVKAAYPGALCRVWDGVWCVTTGLPLVIGFGKTAFHAWFNTWLNIEKERGGK